MRRLIGAMALEPRVMYDAAAVATLGTVAATSTDPTHTVDITATPSTIAAAAPATDASHTTDATAAAAAPSGASVLGLVPAATGAAAPADSSGQQVVFIDPHVPDYQLLAAGVKPGEQVVILNPNTDGVQQIADWLQSHDEQNLAAIHIVSHGEDGTVRLGSTILAANDVNQFAQPLAEIGAALRPGGDILFYGCDVGQGAVGDMFMVDMSMATGGAHIAAASHLVGAADLGGSWNLNVQLGSIDVGNPFTAPTLAAFNDILTNQIWFTTNGTGSGTRVESVGVDGTGATDVVDATQASSLSGLSGIVVDAARGVYFVANQDGSGNNAIYEGSIATGALNPTPIYVGPAFAFDPTTFATNNAYISGLQLDAQTGQLYFAQGVLDTSTGKNLSSETGIFRINEDGTGLTQVVSLPSTSLDAPRNFALDLQDNLVFFTDSSGRGSTNSDGLGIANLTTGAVSFVSSTQLAAVGVTNSTGLLSGIAVDPAHGMLYFTADDTLGHTNHNYIFSAPFTVSGSGTTATATLGTITTLYNVGSTGAPASIVLDVPDGLFFVANATNNPDSSTPVGGSIEVGHLTGSSAGALTTVLQTSAIPGVTGASKPANLAFDSSPTVTAGGGVTYNLNGAPVVVDAGATAADPSGQDLASATVTISSGFLAGDTLTANTTGTAIAASYNSATGVLTLTGADTAAHYQQVLDSIAFSSTNSALEAQRTLTWAVSDGVLASAPATSTVGMTPPPGLAGSAASTFVGGGAAVALDSGITATDAGGTLAGATISISNGFLAGDTLAFTDQNGIHGSYNAAAGILTLSGTASVANYQAALESITYSFAPANGDPTGGNVSTVRTVSWVVSDGAANSNVLTSTLNTVHVAPSLAAGGTATFTGGGAPVTLDSALAVSDVDSNGNLAGATVAISSGFVAGDMLGFTNQNGIAGSYNPTTGVLTLTGTASVASYQAALDSVSYSFSPSNGDPTAGGGNTARSISWSVSDGVASASGASAVNTVHVAPSVAAGGTATFSGGGAPVTLDGAFAVSDIDSNGNLAGATVAISGGFIAGDTLNFANQNGITGSYNAATGVLTLSGTASIANYQAALESVTYGFAPGNGDPTAGGGNTARTISWSVTDGVASASGTSALNTVHVPPSVVAGGTATFTGGGPAVTLDGALTVSDPDSNGNLAGATVSIGGFVAGDSLNFTNQNGITGSYNGATGVLTLTGTASVASYQAALDSVTYSYNPANGDPTGGGANTARTISWSVTDGVSSGAATSALNTVHVAPSVVPDGTATFIGGGPAVTLDSGLTVSDVDSNGNLAGATVSIGSGFVAGDTLNFANQSGITGSYNAATGVLTLTGTASVANYQAALESITYSFSPGNGDPTGGGSSTARTIDWAVNDGVAGSNVATTTLQTVHVAPTAVAGGSATFTGGGAPVTLDGALTVGDVDSNGNLTGATVAISSGFIAGDTLNFANQNGITGSYNAATGVLTLTGTASLANYQAALESITYGMTPGNGDPTGGGGDTSRTVSWSVTDGVASSAVVTSTLSTVHVAPTLAAGGSVTFTGGGAPVTLDGALTVGDVDSNGNLTGATVAISTGFLAGDSLGFTNQNGITGSYNAATGVLTLSGKSTVANYQAALESITYGFVTGGDPTQGGDTNRTISWSVTDGVASSGTATSSVSTVNATHTPPTLSNAGNTVLYTKHGPPATVDSALTITDPDSGGTLAGATVTISAGLRSGDTLAAVTTGTGITASYNANTGVLTLSGKDTIAHYQSVLDSVTYSSTNPNPSFGSHDKTRTITWVVNDGATSNNLSAPVTSTIDDPTSLVAANHLPQDQQSWVLDAPKLTLPTVSDDTNLVTDVTSASSLGADQGNGSEPIWLRGGDNGRVFVQTAAFTTEPYEIQGDHTGLGQPLWVPTRPGETPADSGKPGLLAQLKAAGRQGLVNERQTLLKSLHHRPAAR